METKLDLILGLAIFAFTIFLAFSLKPRNYLKMGLIIALGICGAASVSCMTLRVDQVLTSLMIYVGLTYLSA